LFIETVSSTD